MALLLKSGTCSYEVDAYAPFLMSGRCSATKLYLKGVLTVRTGRAMGAYTMRNSLSQELTMRAFRNL